MAHIENVTVAAYRLDLQAEEEKQNGPNQNLFEQEGFEIMSPEDLNAKPNPKYIISETGAGGLKVAVGDTINQPTENPHKPHQWVGSTGIGIEENEGARGGFRDALRKKIAEKKAPYKQIAVELTPQQVDGHYNGYSNSVLWPIMHDMMHKVDFNALETWDTYDDVNREYAKKLMEVTESGDFIWIHDYQLATTASYLEDRLTAYFHHIPWAQPENFAAIPAVHREKLLSGLLNNALIGFHTEPDVVNFIESVKGTFGEEVTIEVPQDGETRHIIVEYKGKKTLLKNFPISIDAASWQDTANEEEIIKKAEEIRAEKRLRGIQMGVWDGGRKDHSKGFAEGMLAYEYLLQHHPNLRGKVQLDQLMIPTRQNIQAYKDTSAEIDQIEARINKQYGTRKWQPIRSTRTTMKKVQLVANYQAADVVRITPSKDGMNLMVKEAIMSQREHPEDGYGVIIISSGAGAARELGDRSGKSVWGSEEFDKYRTLAESGAALEVNPYDPDDVARAYLQAMNMSTEERKQRMELLKAVVGTNDIQKWYKDYMAAVQIAANVRAAIL